MKRLFGWLALSIVASAAEPTASEQPARDAARIDSRFAADGVAESPDFRQHVVPLLGKLGCNGRACHGSFQGQGGFRLSLFGYDFKADWENLTLGDTPRVAAGKPAESLALRKPLMIEEHDGGKRLEPGTWQHRVLVKWIEDGAAGVTATTPEFVRLEVTPTEMVAANKGDSWQLRAVAVWSNGQREDVTPLCRFQSNNDQVATITEKGLVTAVEPGDTHVVAFYDNGVVPVPVLRPVSDKIGPRYPSVPTPTKVDVLVVDKLRKLGIVPADTCTDAEFLRRASLDITGTLPTAPEVEGFLSDSTSDKRARKIDELLERPGYAAWWATKFCDWTGNNSRNMQNLDPTRGNGASTHWYEWIRHRLATNQPYDEVMEGIVLAKSRLDGESYRDYCERMSDYAHKDAKGSFVNQPYMPYFWGRQNFGNPEERALGFAYTFLGVRIQCAQCHKHPFDQWTKDDFDRFKGFFTRARYQQSPRGEESAIAKEILAALEIDEKTKKNGGDLRNAITRKLQEGKVVPFSELVVEPAKSPNPDQQKSDKQKDKDKKNRQLVAGRTAKVLGGAELTIDEMEDPRTALMDWMRDENNPYFAKAIVNRVWASYFHRGIVEPTDDLSLANPPANEALFDDLAAEFRHHGYDLKWLHREICNSRTYQLSWQSNETNRLDERNFSRAVPRRIPAEVAYDALRMATASDQEAANLATHLDGRAIAEAVVNGRNGDKKQSYPLTVFGRSVRESNCDCDRSAEASLLQTVFLQNDQELLDMLTRRGGWVDQVVKSLPEQSDAENGKGQRKQAERAVGQLQAALKKADAAGNEDKLAKIRQELAAAEERATKLRHVADEAAPLQPAETHAIIRQAYLRSLNRPPTADETARAERYFRETGDLAVGARDVLWALLNTKEFVVNH